MSPADALALASRLHAGQVDKAGQPYIGHLRRVAATVYARGGSDAAQIAAALHDAIEDRHATAQFLADDGVPGAALFLVALLTKAEGQPYADYLAAIKADPDALLVKLADIEDKDLGEKARELLTKILLGEVHAAKVQAERFARAVACGNKR